MPKNSRAASSIFSSTSSDPLSRANCSMPARAMGRDDMGALEPGKLANIAFFSRDPLKGGENLRSVVLTVKRGVDYRRSDYVPVRAEELTEGWDGRYRTR